jgi:hypothetical protein
MKRPSFVRFFSGRRERDDWREPCEAVRWGWGRYAVGSDEADVRAWACCSPSGSLRLCVLERRMTEPVKKALVRHACITLGTKICLPGTSSVNGSLRMPRFHLGREASFSCVVDVAVEPTAPSPAACGFRQGVKLTIPSTLRNNSFSRRKRDVRETARSISHVVACNRYQACDD